MPNVPKNTILGTKKVTKYVKLTLFNNHLTLSGKV